jgi:hypothetical protein
MVVPNNRKKLTAICTYSPCSTVGLSESLVAAVRHNRETKTYRLEIPKLSSVMLSNGVEHYTPSRHVDSHCEGLVGEIKRHRSVGRGGPSDRSEANKKNQAIHPYVG